MTTIHIKGLEVETKIGITAEERAEPQLLLVDVAIEANVTAGTTDAIEDTIDYEEVALAVKELGNTERNTIEKFAEDTAKLVVETYNSNSVTVSVWKDILPYTESVGVTITRP